MVYIKAFLISSFTTPVSNQYHIWIRETSESVLRLGLYLAIPSADKAHFTTVLVLNLKEN